MVQLISQKAMNHVVSHTPEARGAVRAEAGVVAGRAEGRLAAHRKTGKHRVTETHGDVDSFVNLEGPAVLSVEFGHMVKGKFEDPEHPKKVPGLYIITGAAGLAG